VLVAAVGAKPAAAQTMTDNSTAFSVERLTPPPGAGGFFAAEDADVLPRWTWTAALSGSLMARPIVLRNLIDGTEASEPVRTRLGSELGAAVGLGARYQVGLALPLVVQSGDRLRGIDLDEQALDPFAFGDLRVHLKGRLAGAPGAPGVGLGVAATVVLPTGNAGDFAGEKGWMLEWRLIGSYRAPSRRWRVALDLGPRFRTREVVLLAPSQPHGNELQAALAAEVVVPGLPVDAASLLAEYVAVRGDSASGSGSTRGPSPGELRFGGRWRTCPGWSVLAGVGLGTTPDEVGSPAWRAILAVRFETAPTGDLDRDGLPDRSDWCRTVAEDRDGWEDGDGCPDPDDDGDGIPDGEDECPRRPEDFDRDRDLDGCPDWN
jgi:hypothetical protein